MHLRTKTNGAVDREKLERHEVELDKLLDGAKRLRSRVKRDARESGEEHSVGDEGAPDGHSK